MIVLNLACELGHGFEGWFGSSMDFDDQRARSLVACPICGNAQVQRRPTAAHLGVARGKRPLQSSAAAEMAGVDADQSAYQSAAKPLADHSAEAQQHFLQAVRQVLDQTEDVGKRFAEEARRIHYGESEERAIRGQASPAEARDLADEGIAVHALALPESLKGSMQ